MIKDTVGQLDEEVHRVRSGRIRTQELLPLWNLDMFVNLEMFQTL